ncbi:MAG: cell division protein ZapA [Oscillospiraceae bacterium]|nr:cell division protein ZapA [Oscillospiraceae bacterium]
MGKQVIFVGGKRFIIRTEESEAYMKKVVERVDTKLKSIIASNPLIDKESAAILASLDYCDEEYKIRERLEEIKEQIKDYLEETEELHKEIKDLETKNMELQAALERYNKIADPKDTIPKDDIKNKEEKTVKGKKVLATGKIENKTPTVIDGAIQQSLFHMEEI